MTPREALEHVKIAIAPLHRAAAVETLETAVGRLEHLEEENARLLQEIEEWRRIPPQTAHEWGAAPYKMQ